LEDSPEEKNLRNLIAVAIENALLEIGRKELEKVESMLEADYKSNFFDCMDHPEYLGKILRELYPDNNKIAKSILKNLKGFIPKSLFNDFQRELTG